MAETRSSRLTWGETTIFWSMVIASFMLVFGVAVLPDCRRSLALEKRLGEMREYNAQLALHVQKLEQEKQALEKDPFYVEKVARKMLNLRRPGEVVYLSLSGGGSDGDVGTVKPNNPAPSVVTEVMNRLEPLATNGAVRLFAVVLALANLLAAFTLFGRDDPKQVPDPSPL